MTLFICFFLFSALAQCTSDKGKYKKSRHHSSKKTATIEHVVSGERVISGNETGILVTAEWMKKYQALESKHGTIPADDKIWMEGDQYRIPPEVANHFNDMVRAQ